MTRPIHWPSLSAPEAEEEWRDLLSWVTLLQARYPHGVTLPECWWRHPEIVEALAALRDCERGCFDPQSSSCAAMNWQRARLEMDTLLARWIKRLTCAIPGRGHTSASDDDTDMSVGWQDFIDADIARRTTHATGTTRPN